jgi:hypothetical protein
MNESAPLTHTLARNVFFVNISEDIRLQVSCLGRLVRCSPQCLRDGFIGDRPTLASVMTCNRNCHQIELGWVLGGHEYANSPSNSAIIKTQQDKLSLSGGLRSRIPDCTSSSQSLECTTRLR